MLAELQLGWEHLRYRQWSLRQVSGPGGADPDDLRRLSEQAEAEDELSQLGTRGGLADGENG